MKTDNGDIKTDIAVIKEQVSSIKEMVEKFVEKVEAHDREITELKTEIKNFNSFQTFLTFIGTSVATALAYLMANKR